jgi:oxalate decarboxylase/phosphoglucose isomerase-like protein (cupin superfamily)
MQPTTTRHDTRLKVGSDELTIRVTAAESGGALLAFEVRMPPGGGPPALHRHDPAELYRVERGEFALYIADADGSVSRYTAGPGDVVAIPGGREHTVRNESAAEGVAFVVFSPGGDFERFVRAAAVSDDPAALAAEHGIEMTRPLEEDGR